MTTTIDAPADDAASLCTGCGMCCDGTLFGRAPVEPGEAARVAAHGLEVFERDGREYFRLPCPRLTPSGCGIYAERFEICHRYRCVTLRALDAGSIDLAEASRRVALAKAERAKAAAIGQFGNAERKLALMKLNIVLDRYFRKPSQHVVRGMGSDDD